MVELAKHIEILLLDNDCVIVPDFGGFMAHHVDAVYDEEEGLFLPPRRTLGFNPQLYINDSLLAQSYVEAYDISYPDAMNRIESEVREIRQTLSLEGRFELPDIGVISRNDDGNIEFTPCLSGILTPSIYALTSFEMSVLQSVKSEEEVAGDVNVEIPVRTVKARKKAEKLIKLEPKKSETITVGASEEGKSVATILSIDTGLVRNIAAVAVILLMVLFSSLPFGEAVPTSVQQCSMDSNIFSRIMPQAKESAREKMEVVKVVNNAVVKTERTESEDSILKEVEMQQKGEYVIVLASKVSKTNGQVLIEQLKKEGVKDARLVERTNCNRVVCGSYDSETDAQVASAQMRESSSRYQDVWIMKLN